MPHLAGTSSLPSSSRMASESLSKSSHSPHSEEDKHHGHHVSSMPVGRNHAADLHSGTSSHHAPHDSDRSGDASSARTHSSNHTLPSNIHGSPAGTPNTLDGAHAKHFPSHVDDGQLGHGHHHNTPPTAEVKPKYGLAVKKTEQKPKTILEAFRVEDVESFSELVKACPNPQDIINNPENPLLCQAARMNHIGFLKAIMRADPWSVMTQDSDRRAALHFAALQGSMEGCTVLLEMKPEKVKSKLLVSQLDDKKMHALHCAVLSGNEELVEYLLVQGEGGGIDVPNGQGQYALHMACSKGMDRAVAALCKLPNSKTVGSILDGQGSSVLHLATQEGYGDVVAVLLAHEMCSPNLQDSHGWTALHLAYVMEMDSTAELLLPHTNPCLRDSDGKTAGDIVRGDEWYRLPSVATWYQRGVKN